MKQRETMQKLLVCCMMIAGLCPAGGFTAASGSLLSDAQAGTITASSLPCTGVYYLDADGDGYGDPSVFVQACEAPDGYVDNGGDCDDNNFTAHPRTDESSAVTLPVPVAAPWTSTGISVAAGEFFEITMVPDPDNMPTGDYDEPGYLRCDASFDKGCEEVPGDFMLKGTIEPSGKIFAVACRYRGYSQQSGILHIGFNDCCDSCFDDNRGQFLATVKRGTCAAAPLVSFIAESVSGRAPLSVAFIDTTQSEVPAAKWQWDFGDGAAGTEQNPTHIYTADGSYTVRLAVSAAGVTASAAEINYITVQENLPAADFSASITAGKAPLRVLFTDTSSGAIAQRQWNFGDGTRGSLKNQPHIFKAPGTYTVTLTVTGPGGTSTRRKTDYITAGPADFSSIVSGVISGRSAASFQVSLAGPLKMLARTDTDGAYAFAGVTAGTYIVTPFRQGVAFEPASRRITVAEDDVSGIDFTASPQALEIGGARAKPVKAFADGTMAVLFTAQVSSPGGPSQIASVVIDINEIAGSVTATGKQAELPMNDSGNGGDAVAGDGIYTCRTTVARDTPPGLKALRIIATGAGGRRASIFVSLEVINVSTRTVRPGAVEKFTVTNAVAGQTLRFKYALSEALRAMQASAALEPCSALLEILNPGGALYLKAPAVITEAASEIIIPAAESGVWTCRVTNQCAAEHAVTLETCSAGTGIVNGTVIDADTGDGIDGASIQNDIGAAATCNEGYYLLISPSGVFTVEATDMAHASASRTVTVSSGESVELDFVMEKEGSGSSTCFAAEALGGENAESLVLLRRLRDERLSLTEEGRRYTQLYYRYSPEIKKMLSSNEALRRQVRNGIVELLPVAESLVKGAPLRMEPGQKALLKRLCVEVRQQAGPGLAKEIAAFMARLDQNDGF